MARCGWLTRWRSWSKDKVMRWLLWIGLAGILLIALSEIFPRGEKEEQTASVTVSGAQVEQALEQRIAALLR